MKTVILVGTETGNSMDYALRASENLERMGVESEIFLMDEFPLEGLLENSLETLIFICSTTGDGEEPRNMKRFMKFILRADLPSNLFSEIKFTVFGLGDSSYDKFNYVSKRVYRRMKQLGGQDIIGFRGDGDERHSNGIEGGWNIWWNSLKDKIPIGNTLYSELEPLPPRCTLNTSGENSMKPRLDPSNVNLGCKFVNSRRVTPLNHFQDTRLLEFKVFDTFEFQPGDILNLKPSNDPRLVDELFQMMGWKKDLIIYGVDGKNTWINDMARSEDESSFPMSLDRFLTDYVDITRIPNKSTMRTLACLCDPNLTEYSLMHQEKLLELSKDEGEYLDYVWRPKRSILEIIKDFQPTLKIGIDRILQVFQPIKPRQFSIANDVKDGKVELLISLIKEELPQGRGSREGLCSNWIARNEINSLKSVTISHGSLNPKILKSNVFLFAAGTGIAPLRSVIQRLKQSGKKLFLYFGCRSLEIDFYFKDEWKDYDNLRVFSLGSRDNKGGSRIYLDQVIKIHSEPLVSFDNPTEVSCLVAGHSRLNKIVQTTLNEIWKDPFEGKTWVEWLKSYGQYQTETWS